MRRPCLECGRPAPGSYCAAHQPPPWAGSTRKYELPVDWRRTRAEVIARDTRCLLCGSTHRLEVDHIADRHDHTLGNLRALCHSCHATRTGRQGAAVANGRR